MKNSISLFFCLIIMCLSLNAQSKKQEKPKNENPREERKIGITTELGLKSLVGTGLIGSYYVHPQVAIDVGAGIGFHGLRGGIRGRYFLLNKKFAPYVGAGLFFNPNSIEGLPFPNADGFSESFINLKKSNYGQFVLGFEYMGKRGFIFGMNLGYSKNFSDDTWSSDDIIDNDTRLILDVVYGSGLATGFNIGFAF